MVENVWPYLLPSDYVHSYVLDEDDNSFDSDSDDDNIDGIGDVDTEVEGG